MKIKIYLITVILALAIGYMLHTYISQLNPPTLTIQYQCVNWEATEW